MPVSIFFLLLPLLINFKLFLFIQKCKSVLGTGDTAMNKIVPAVFALETK